jgi:hypothetical protein
MPLLCEQKGASLGVKRRLRARGSQLAEYQRDVPLFRPCDALAGTKVAPEAGNSTRCLPHQGHVRGFIWGDANESGLHPACVKDRRGACVQAGWLSAGDCLRKGPSQPERGWAKCAWHAQTSAAPRTRSSMC